VPESVSHTDRQLDLVVDRLNARIGQLVLQCCQDRIVVPANLPLQLHEFRNPAVLCPLDEVIRLFLPGIQSVMEYQPQFFFQKVCPVQAVVLFGDQFKLRLLVLSQVLKILSESELAGLDVLCCGVRLCRILGWPSRSEPLIPLGRASAPDQISTHCGQLC